MSQPDPKSPPPEDQATTLNASTDPELSELALSVSAHDGRDPLAVTKIEPAESEEHRFSPSEDTFSAIKDLGLRLQPAPDHNVIGRMAHYDIIRCLGRGGMGTVFEAFDTKLFRPVAIKFMASSLAASEKARSRFLREARVAASINHPNVVTIHAVDEYDGRPYLVMEFVSGTTLHEHVRKIGPLPLGDILRISRQIATGLRAAHDKGIVHRDIKPGNILLESSVQRVKIVDFGLAQVIFELSDITSLGQTLGTPRYMSPEQIEGSRVDERADLFSFGCVIYMMCVGHPPFSGNSITVLHTILRDAHVPIRQVMPQIPQALSDMVDSLLSKSREQRLQTAAIVEETITGIARGGTPSDEYLRVQHAEKKPLPAKTRSSLPGIGAAVALVAASAMLAWSIWGQRTPPEKPSTVPTQQEDPQGMSVVTDNPAESVDRGPITMTVGGSQSDFPSLQAALLKVQPGDRLAVQGTLPPDDVLVLNDASRHSNLTIEWRTDTPFDYSGSAAAVITIDSVPGVRIQGAKMRAFNAHLLSIRGDCHGLVMENCRLEQAPKSHQAAVVFWDTSRGIEASPIQLSHCEIVFWEAGILCKGSANSAVQWVQLTENVIRGLQPIWGIAINFEDSVRHMKVQHNRITSVRRAVSVIGVWDQVEVANNTFFDVMECFGADQVPTSKSVKIVGNLAIQSDTFATGISPDDRGFGFAFNKSDLLAVDPRLALTVKTLSFVSTDAAHPEFMRPLVDPQLKIPRTPEYAGALEPRKLTPDTPKAAGNL
ncbi:MAG: serine/threonine protein kinase [Fuerstia sp.]|nr:serine/threonine protein kinase [Fuerstiella sp.]